MSITEDYARAFLGPAVEIDGAWVVTNICHQGSVGVETVAVGPTTHADALGHALMWNADPRRNTTWIIRRAVPADTYDSEEAP